MAFSKTKFDQVRKDTASSKEIKKLHQDIERSMPKFKLIEKEYFGKGIKTFRLKVSDHLFVYDVGGRLLFFEVQTDKKKSFVCPNLILVLEYPDLLPCVYVDEGAVRPLLNGSSLKAPGVKEIPQPFEKDAVVAVRLLGHEEAFALGIATMSSEQLKEGPKGTAVDIQHILKDALWDKRDGI